MSQVGRPPNSKYEILRPLASGGMGEIFLARMRGIEGFERLVVIKRMRPEVSQQAQTVSMFLDEMRLLASVQHSNVVHIYDVGTTPEGSYFYAMEFLHGQDLRSIARRFRGKGMPLSPALSICMGALSGLHHVHERRGSDGKPLNIVHRDISPANLFVTYDGQVKLLDFGIAKSERRTSQTDAGTVKGKFRYMSPEQVRAQPVDRRSDLFSLGVVLWEITTGRTLFKGDNDVQTILSVAEQEPTAPSAVKPGYPPQLEQVVMRALKRDVAQRYQTGLELQQALEGVAREQAASLSSGALADFMGLLFAEEIAAWQAAQEEGKDLAQHVAETWRDSGSFTGGGTPVSTNSRLPLITATPAPSGETVSAIAIDVDVGGSPRRRTGLVVLAIAGALLVGAGAGAVAWLRQEPPPPAPPLLSHAAPPQPPPPAAPEPPRIAEPPPVQPAPTTAEILPAEQPAEPAPPPKAPPARPARPPKRPPGRGPAPTPAQPTPTPAAPSPTWEKDSPLPPT